MKKINSLFFTKTNLKKNIDTKRKLIKLGLMSFVFAFIALCAFQPESKTSGIIAGAISLAVFPLIKIKMSDDNEVELKAEENETEKAYQERALLVKVTEEVKRTIKKYGSNINSEELKTIKEMAEKAAKITDLDELKEAMNAIGLEIKAFKEIQADGAKKNSLVEEIKSKLVALKALASGPEGAKELVVKALTNRASVAGNEQAFELPDIGQLATRKLSLYDLFPKITIADSNNNGIVRYYDWDKDTIARAAAAVAEGAPFPESTAKFTTNTIALKKIGDTLPVTEEFFEDEAMFAGELSMFLEVNVNLEIDRQLYLADGSANQITGLVSSVPAYVLPGNHATQDCNIYDLIAILSAAITKAGGAKYAPNFVVMNIADILRMQLKKDGFNNYVIPPFASKDGKQVGQVYVIESNIVTANTLVIGDSKFARIYEKGGITLERGMVNAQFTADEMTLKVRKRMLFLIRVADANGFLYVSDITAALADENKV